MVDNLNEANEVRQKTEETLKRVQQDYELQAKQLKHEKEEASEKRAEFEKVASRLHQAEKDVDELKIKTDSLKK